MEFVKEAPVFRPTLEEFENPLTYINKIRTKAEAAGICKIIPPAGWRPPFAVDTKKFKFRTRVQNLCKIDGQARIEREFLWDVRKFLFKKGIPMGENPLPLVPSDSLEDAKVPLRLYRLYAIVARLGGGTKVTVLDLWEQVARALFPLADDEDFENLKTVVKTCYLRYLMAYELERGIVNPILPKVVTNRNVAPTFDSTMEQLMVRAVSGASDGMKAILVGKKSTKAATHAIEQGELETQSALHNPSLQHEEVQVVHYKPRHVRSSKRGRSGDEAHQYTASDIKCTPIRVKRKRVAPRLGAPPLPEVSIGATFFRHFENINMCLLGEIVSLDESTGLYTIQYVSNNETQVVSHEEKVTEENAVMLLASGETEVLAEEAAVEGICQICLRADCPERMLLCDECNFGYHATCLPNPCRVIPSGDWFCDVCMREFDAISSPLVGSVAEECDTDDSTTPLNSPEAIVPHHQEPRQKMQVSAMPKGLKGMRKKIGTFGFGEGETYTLHEYKEMANRFKDRYIDRASKAKNPNIQKYVSSKGSKVGDAHLEKEYWRLVSDAARTETDLLDIKVSYGSDLDTGRLGSGFPSQRSITALKKAMARHVERQRKKNGVTATENTGKKSPAYLNMKDQLEQLEAYSNDGWNLNNFPKLNGSLLQYVDEDITGVIVPWMYIGMFFSSFCWHTEDHNFASINYHHWGEPKTWYGVPSQGAEAFERAAESMTPELFSARSDILTGIVTQYNPTELAKQDVPVYHTTQRKGEFVITFPQAYHGGFNHGLNCAEAVNFATDKWLPYGEASVVRYSKLRKNPVISHDALLVGLAAVSVSTTSSTRASDDDSESGHLCRVMYRRLEKLVWEELEKRELARTRNYSLVKFDDEIMYAQQQSIMSSPTMQYDENAAPSSPIATTTTVATTTASSSSSSSSSSTTIAATPTRNDGNPMTRDRSPMHPSSGADGKTYDSSSGNVYGRERSHMARLVGAATGAKKAPGDQGYLVQLQCCECKQFCSLSLFLSPENGNVYCWEHGFALGDELDLVVVWSEERLLSLLARVGEAGIGIAKWRRNVWEKLGYSSGENQFDLRVTADRLEALDGMDGSSPANDGHMLPPGVMYTLEQEVLPGKRVTVEEIEELIQSAVEVFKLDTEAEEAMALKDLCKSGKACLDQVSTVVSTTHMKHRPPMTAVEDMIDSLAKVKRLVVGPSVDALRSTIEHAAAWKAKARKMLSDYYQGETLLTSLPSSFNDLQQEYISTLQLHVEPEYSELLNLEKEVKWLVTAKDYISDGCDMRTAKAHLARAQRSLSLTRKVDLDLLSNFNDHLSKSETWVQDAEKAVSSKNPSQMFGLLNWVKSKDLCKFVPNVQQESLQRNVNRLEEWINCVKQLGEEKDTETEETAGETNGSNGTKKEKSSPHGASMSGTLSSSSASHNYVSDRVDSTPRTSRIKQSEIAGLMSVGEKLGFNLENSPEMATLHQYIADAVTWKQAVCGKLLKNVNKDIIDPEAKVSVGISAEDTLTGLLREKLAIIKGGPSNMKRPVFSGKIEEEQEDKAHRAGKRFCLCQLPEARCDRFMFACDFCSEWYHPGCLGTSRQAVKSLNVTKFACPACVLHGKLAKPAKREGLYCYCQNESGESFMVGCDMCNDWYHPLCVGISETQAREISNYICPACCITKGVTPMVPTSCVCKRPDLGRVKTLVGCAECGDKFHPSCVANFRLGEAAKDQYYCESCCRAHDVPYFLDSGECGFLPAWNYYLGLQDQALRMSAARITSTGRMAVSRRSATLTELEDLCRKADETLYCVVSEETNLRTLLQALYQWIDDVSATDVANATSVDLWKLLYREALFPVTLPEQHVLGIVFELWRRFSKHVLYAKPCELEKRSARAVGDVVTTNPRLLRFTRAFFQNESFRQFAAAKTAAATDPTEASTIACLLKEFNPEKDHFHFPSSWDLRCKTAVQRYELNGSETNFRTLVALEQEWQEIPGNKSPKGIVKKLKRLVARKRTLFSQ